MKSKCVGIVTTFENSLFLDGVNRKVSTLPIVGKYSAVDFPLSYMKNAGIQNIHILTSKNCYILNKHLDSGKPWGLDRKSRGLTLHIENVETDTKLLINNFEDFFDNKEEIAAISSIHMISNLELDNVIKFHQNSNADITVVYKNVEEMSNNFLECDILEFNNKNHLIKSYKNLEAGMNRKVSLEIFLIKTSLLASIVTNSSNLNLSLKEIIYESKTKLKILGFEYKGYLACLNSVTNYFNLNMDFINHKNLKTLFFNEKMPVFSKVKDLVPTHYSSNDIVKSSIISDGCYIKGSVINSILSEGVKIEDGAKVENCIILENCTIKSGTYLKDVIADEKFTLKVIR